MKPPVHAAAIALVVTAALAVAASTPLGGQAPQVEPADLVIRGGRILTLDARVPEAQALAAREGRIVALGSVTDIERYVGARTEIIELGGQFAMPGFIEGHGHFTGIGNAKLGLELMNTGSWDEIVQMVAEAAAKARPGQWVVGRGWHQEKWSSTPQPNVEGFPLKASLDRVSPNNPVILTHASGHASFANSKALELSGVTRETPNPNGGEILRDANGEPTGLMRETASGLIRRGAGEPDPTPEEVEARERQVLHLADQEVIAKGITSFQDAGSSFGTVNRIKEEIDAGRMNVRLWVMIRGGNAESLARGRVVGYGRDMLTVRAIKITADGALGSRGAWLLQPYSDKPDSTGLATTPIERVAAQAQVALDAGYQVCVHAIGDRANREVLDVYDELFRKNNRNGRDLRWRIEHAQHLHRDDIERFGRLNVIASMQGVHATSDAPWVEPRLGAERAEEGAYVWQKLMQSGAVVTNGTDAPVEDVDPIASYYATVTRRTNDGMVFYADQALSRIDALK
ncbi:MAG TPA: amidohydrolase, partial [Vicinamibacterales bacterium]|nr:amidohydrolase [Vicinamibacterales bacterium]